MKNIVAVLTNIFAKYGQEIVKMVESVCSKVHVYSTQRALLPLRLSAANLKCINFISLDNMPYRIYMRLASKSIIIEVKLKQNQLIIIHIIFWNLLLYMYCTYTHAHIHSWKLICFFSYSYRIRTTFMRSRWMDDLITERVYVGGCM